MQVLVLLCGNTSPSIEPFRANAYTQKTKTGSNLVKNKFLDALIKEKVSTELYEELGILLLQIKEVYNILNF